MHLPDRSLFVVTSLALSVASAPLLNAQASRSPAAGASSSEEEAVVLSPFEVSTERDFGYVSTATLSGGRLSTELRNTAAAVSVLPREFLDDIGASSVQESLLWATNSVAPTASDVTPGSGGNETSGVTILAFGGTSVTVRGIRSATIALNYFPWSNNLDTYNTERLDISRGPNALVFGDASSGGIVNISTKRARDRDFGSISHQLSSYGGQGRTTVDINRKISDNFALRAVGLRQRGDGWRDFSKTGRDAIFLTTTWTPYETVQVRVEGERGKSTGTTPVNFLRDGISRWDGSTVRVFGQPGNPPASAGLISNANPFLHLSYPELGLIPGAGMFRTNGGDRPIGLDLPPNVPADGLLPIDTGAAATLGQGRQFPTISDYAFSNRAAARRFDIDFTTASFFIEKRFGDNFFMELAGNLQDSLALVYEPLSSNKVFLDVMQTLPTGVLINGSNANPDYLKPFSLDGERTRVVDRQSSEFRISGVYQMKNAWMNQRIGMLASQRNNENSNQLQRLVRVNGTNPNLNDVSNLVFFKTPLDDRSKSSIDFEYGRTHTLANGAELRHVNFGAGNGASAGDETLKSLQVFASGSWLGGERIHTVFGARRDFLDSKSFSTRVFDPVTGALTRIDLTSSKDQAVTSPSAGIVGHVTPWLSLFANSSRSFVAGSGGERTPTEEVTDPAIGKGYDFGVKLNLLEGRLSASLSYYESEETNNVISLLGISSQLQNISFAIGENITYNNSTDTQSAFATGYELDLTANLTPNWTLILNVGIPTATQTNGAPFSKRLVAENRDRWIAAGNVIGGTVPAEIATALANLDFQFSLRQDGRPINTVRDYTANFFTRYRFSEGRLKGLSLGFGANFLGDNFVAVLNDQEVFTGSYRIFSAMIGYDAKIADRDVRFQVNVSNLLDDENFRYMGFNAALQPTNYRVSDPREVRFSTTFKF